jgi:mono/diheme cytochrome c family protein
MACPYCLPIMLPLAVSVSADVKDKPRIKHVPAENVSAAKGPEMFLAYCPVCHGKDGQAAGQPSRVNERDRILHLQRSAKSFFSRYLS